MLIDKKADMKRAQIRELAAAVAENGGMSDNDLQWVFKKFSRQELKSFAYLLSREMKDKSVTVFFAGEIGSGEKKRIENMFPGRNIEFKRDDAAVTAGLRFEYGDYVLDYSVSGIITRILNGIKESL